MKKQIFFALALSLTFLASCNRELSEINITSLPTPITTYIAINYPGYHLDEAQKDTLCNGTAGIEVELEKKGAEDISLFFNNENVFVLKEAEIKYRDLPTAVQSYITTNYPNFKLPEEADKITLANNTIQYEVDIKEKTTKIEKEIVINSDGTSKICAR